MCIRDSHKDRPLKKNRQGAIPNEFLPSYEREKCVHGGTGQEFHLVFRDKIDAYDPLGFPHPEAWTRTCEPPYIFPEHLEDPDTTYVLSRFPVRMWKEGQWTQAHWVIFTTRYSQGPGPETNFSPLGRTMIWSPLSHNWVIPGPEGLPLTKPISQGDPFFDIQAWADNCLLYTSRCV